MNQTRRFIPIGVLILLELALFITNYHQGTFLIGWDNIMPEFNIKLNLTRSLFSLWQEYRGLGLVDGMAHSANLMHTLYIFLLSLVFPTSILRYIFIHLTHLIGGLGFYFLLNHLLKNKKASLLGGLFYMLNFGIIQMYFAPLEVFATHFATLPIISYLIIKAFENPSKKQLLFLFLGALLTTPQGFVPTVFITSFILFFSLIVFYTLKTNKTNVILVIPPWREHPGSEPDSGQARMTRNMQYGLLVLLTFLSANAFWLIPYGYSAIYTPEIIKNTRINEFSSEEIYYRNAARGDLQSILTLKGFMVDSIEYDNKKSKEVFFMENWKNFLNNPFYIAFMATVTLFAIIGFAYSLKKKQYIVIPLAITFGVSFFFLANNTLVLKQANDLIRTIFPTLGEAFRFPFTKFITVYVFCLSVFLSFGLHYITVILGIPPWRETPESKRTDSGQARMTTRVNLLFHILIAVGILWFSIPAFQGYFTSPLLKLELPKEYLDTFSYFNSANPDKRIALLPTYTFWNWQYRSWGHRGSGFLWYGIRQPILERAFDPWSNYNEQYYNEMANAINSADSEQFKYVLEKYDISYILIDGYLKNTLSTQPINYESLNRFLSGCQCLTKKKEFGKIVIYETKNTSGWVYSFPKSKITQLSNHYKYERNDQMRVNYIVSKNDPQLSYIFPSLSTEKTQQDQEFKVVNKNNSFEITPREKQLYKKGEILNIPSILTHEFLIPVTVENKSGTFILTPQTPKILINNKEVPYKENPIIIVSKRIKNPITVTFVDINHTLNLKTENQSYLLNNYPNVIKISDGIREELLGIDTRDISGTSYTYTLPEGTSDVKIIIEKIKSPFLSNDVIKNSTYEIRDPQSTILIDDLPSKINIAKTNTGVIMKAQNNKKELAFYKNNLYHQASYIMSINTNYISGLPMTFYIDNPWQKRAELETRLSKTAMENIIVIPKTEEFYQGYGFHFVIKSLGLETAESIIKNIELYPFPSETIRGMYIAPVGFTFNSVSKKPVSYKHPNISSYKIDTVEPDSILTLSQAYSPGWRAYEIKNQESRIMNQGATIFPFIFGTELKDHVLVNNWANGWEIEPSATSNQQSEITILFLPQYLEHLGFLLLFAPFTAIILNLIWPRLRHKSALRH